MITKPIIKHPNETKTLEQVIVETHNNYVTVESRKGNQYDVNLSDIVKMTMHPKKGDLAIVKTFQNQWLVTGIKEKEVEPVLSEAEEQAELERQLKELEDLGWGAY